MSAGLLSAILEAISNGNKSGRSPTVMIIHPGDEPVGGYNPNMSDDELVSRNDAMIQAAARMRHGAAPGGDDEGADDLNDPFEALEPKAEEMAAHGPTIGRQPNGFPVKAGAAGKAPPVGKFALPKIGGAKSSKSPKEKIGKKSVSK